LIEHPIVQGVLRFLDTGLLDWSNWQILAFTLIVTHITIAGVTIYLHRCQAHRALDLHAIPSHFFRFWLWLTTGMETKAWAAIHRKHHAKCETEDDPHSPRTRGIRKVLLEGAELYREAAKDETVKAKYGHGTPDDWLERNIYTRHSAKGVALMLVINILLFGVIGVSVWAVQMLWIPILAAGVINGLGHWWGYRNYDCPDGSTNLVPIGILIGGEEMHNNHHAFGTSAKFSSKWYEFDVGWLYIRILSVLGLAKVRKVAPAPRFVAPRASVDQQTLQAVIAYRYDLMQAYGRAFSRTLREEVAQLRRAGSTQWQSMVGARKLFVAAGQDGEAVAAPARAQLREAVAPSETLKKLVEMREDLAKTWERSHMTPEQLLAHLQDWCARAEASGVRALQELALRMRRYGAATGA